MRDKPQVSFYVRLALAWAVLVGLVLLGIYGIVRGW